MTENGREREKRLQRILEQAESFAREDHADDATGHDWWHVYRVFRLADRLAREEGADPLVSGLAALLHDIPDEKRNASKEDGRRKVEAWLASQPLAEEERAHILEIIDTMSFNAGANPPMRTPEGRVVQDADRLDALGAIGIARAFQYAGARGQAMHDPRIAPRETMTPAQYRGEKSTAVNHFHEKLLKLRERINTDSARRIAEERHAFLVEFLERFQREWDGE